MIQQEVRDGWIYRNGVKVRRCGQYPDDTAEYNRALARVRFRQSRETEYCDDCGERIGFYDPSAPEGEKIFVTRKCSCVRRDEARQRRGASNE